MLSLLCALSLAQAPVAQVIDLPDAPAYVLDQETPLPPPPMLAPSMAPPAALELPQGAPVIPQIQPGREIDWGTQVARRAWSAAHEGRWGLVVSILLMACLSLFSFLFIRVKELRDDLRNYMPEVALGVSLLGYLAIGLEALPPHARLVDWWEVILPAIKTGAAAVGLYEIAVKRLIQFWGPRLWALVKRLRGGAKPPTGA